MRLILNSKNAEGTTDIGLKIGRRLKGGEVIVLQSDLGGGKTTFVQGLAQGMKIHENVTSPTFIVTNVYKSSYLELHHYDFYRLGKNIEIMGQELKEVLSDPIAVCVIEWPDYVMGFLPTQRLMTIKFDRMKEGEDLRKITIEFQGKIDYLLGDIK